MSARELAPCGTPGAYQRHVRRGEVPDEPCRQANAAASRALRSKTDRWRMSNRARNRALTRLSQSHWNEFHELYLVEMAKETAP